MATRLSGKRKHTLDSDEEDDEDVPTYMNEDELQGEEEGDVDIEDGTRFTPFHMKDELEEGHFDGSGMYIFKKSKDEIRDSWIEDVNWSEVKTLEKTLKLKKNKEELEEPEEEINEQQLLKQIITYMLPKETVTNAIKRLGKTSGSNSSSKKWKNKKLKANENTENLEEETAKKQLLELISCADKLLSNGFTTIYQATYEKLVVKLKSLEQSTAKINTAIDADFDIFAPDENASKADTEQICWEFKWEDKEKAECYGPYSSEQMLKWQDEGYFKDGVFVRKTTADGKEFHSSRRIDFSLYV